MNWLEAFGHRIRSPREADVPDGLPAGRMAVYERLFFNTQKSLLDKGFPRLRSLLGDLRWEQLIRLWLQNHRSREPLFPDLGEEFVAWIATHPCPPDWPEAPDLLAELAHHERVETSLYLHEDPPEWSGWSPLAWPLAYRWPVHQSVTDQHPLAPPGHPSLLLARRDASGQVCFDILSMAAWQLAMALQQGEPIDAALRRLTGHAGHDEANTLLKYWRDVDLWRP
jgi:hypothetical protein